MFGSHDGALPWDLVAHFYRCCAAACASRHGRHRGLFTILLCKLALSRSPAPTRGVAGTCQPLAGQRQPNKLNHTIPPRDVVLEKTRCSRIHSTLVWGTEAAGTHALQASSSKLERLDFTVDFQQNLELQNSSQIGTLVLGTTRHNALRAGQPATPDPSRNLPTPRSHAQPRPHKLCYFLSPGCRRFFLPLSSPERPVRAQHVMIGRSFVMFILACD
jgi:hypothetical protein